MPIDYSKWDNLEDDDGDEPPPQKSEPGGGVMTINASALATNGSQPQTPAAQLPRMPDIETERLMYTIWQLSWEDEENRGADKYLKAAEAAMVEAGLGSPEMVEKHLDTVIGELCKKWGDNSSLALPIPEKEQARLNKRAAELVATAEKNLGGAGWVPPKTRPPLRWMPPCAERFANALSNCRLEARDTTE